MLDELERMASELGTLAADADNANPPKRDARSRMPDPAVITLSVKIQAFEDKLALLRRELKDMQR